MIVALPPVGVTVAAAALNCEALPPLKLKAHVPLVYVPFMVAVNVRPSLPTVADDTWKVDVELCLNAAMFAYATVALPLSIVQVGLIAAAVVCVK